MYSVSIARTHFKVPNITSRFGQPDRNTHKHDLQVSPQVDLNTLYQLTD